MNKTELIIKVAGIVLSTAVGIGTIIVEKNRKNDISDDDKKDIANITADEVIKRLSNLELEPQE